MTGKVRRTVAATEVSTGGSLISHEKLKQLYTIMMQCRLLNEHAAGLGKNGTISRDGGSMGQEAIAAGWMVDLRPGDTVAPAAGDCTAALMTGIPLSDVLSQISGQHVEVVEGSQLARNMISPSLSPDQQLSAVTAVAKAHKRKKKGDVVIAFTNRASALLACWDEALTTAAKRRLPIIFVVENNPWSLQGKSVDTGVDISQKARSLGLPGITVDGNDVVAVYRVAHESLERARQGDGPMLVEGKTYRESAPIPRSRRGERDPLIHMERYLAAKKLFTPSWKDQIVEQFSRELAAAKAGLGT